MQGEIILVVPYNLEKNDNPPRYLQTLHSISAEKNSTIIFPLPMELLGGFNEAQVRGILIILMRPRGSITFQRDKFICPSSESFAKIKSDLRIDDRAPIFLTTFKLKTFAHRA